MHKRWIYLGILFPLVIFSTACQPRVERSVLREKPQARFEKGTSRIYKREGSYPLSNSALKAPETGATASVPDTQRAEAIAEAVNGLEEIEKTAVVTMGPIAIVGIQMKRELPEEDLIKEKERVEKKVKETVPGIRQVGVSTEGKLFERISRMSDAARREKPGYPEREEVEALYGQLTPVR